VKTFRFHATDFSKFSKFSGVQEIRLDRGDTDSGGEYTYLYGKRNENRKLGIVKKDWMSRECSTNEKERTAHEIMVGK
jgi:hypothetical protein